MRIGISRPSGTPEEAVEVLHCAHEYGFQGVQLKPAQYEPFLDAPERFSAAYGDRAELARGGLIIYPGGDPAEWPQRLDKVMSFAHAVGADHICICACVYSSGASEAEVQTIADTLTTIGTTARKQGLVISIHNHVGSIVETEADILRLLERLDPRVCGLTYDTAHAAKAGVTDLTSLLHKVKPHLLNVHLKDLDEAGNFCALGKGRLELAPILTILRKMQYDEWLIVDEETRSISTPEAMMIAHEYLKGHRVMS